MARVSSHLVKSDHGRGMKGKFVYLVNFLRTIIHLKTHYDHQKTYCLAEKHTIWYNEGETVILEKITMLC